MKHLRVDQVYESCGLSAATEGLFGDAIVKIKDFISNRKKFALKGIVCVAAKICKTLTA